MTRAETYFYEPAKGHGLPHDPFKAIVAPRPIGWIGSRDAEGRGNLAPYSFFNAMCDTPPVVAFSSAGRKDSLRNIQATGEFVANFANQRLAAAMNASSAPFAHGEDELAITGLTPAPGRAVSVPHVAEAAAALECRLLQVLELKDLDGRSTDHFVVFGQVVGVHIDPAFLNDGLFDTGAAGPIMRAGYLSDYAAVGREQIVKLKRPKSAEEGRDFVRRESASD
ncbi:flavin reductase family protein [Oleiagrimonas sp. C23AA]|uniref:flavin reductase family protein n=1 Tax=Oleiagrimonas sp. C23AA TaxID=2719047 RepID=UPI0014213C6C|nr:flavin reductase family protein [Oleiagrimonas sp. C23AA]NII10792.1 flavin reductase family protein [Oleiagrimonas sp. C23AA]